MPETPEQTVRCEIDVDLTAVGKNGISHTRPLCFVYHN